MQSDKICILHMSAQKKILTVDTYEIHHSLETGFDTVQTWCWSSSVHAEASSHKKQRCEQKRCRDARGDVSKTY